jgi:hypothetical protein
VLLITGSPNSLGPFFLGIFNPLLHYPFVSVLLGMVVRRFAGSVLARQPVRYFSASVGAIGKVLIIGVVEIHGVFLPWSFFHGSGAVLVYGKGLNPGGLSLFLLPLQLPLFAGACRFIPAPARRVCPF